MGDRPRLPQFLVFFYVEKIVFCDQVAFFQINVQTKGYLFEKEIAIEFEKLAREKVPILKA